MAHATNFKSVYNREKYFCINNSPSLPHVAYRFSNAKDDAVSTFSSTGVYLRDLWINFSISRCKAGRSTLGVAPCVEVVNNKVRISKEVRLSEHAVWPKSTWKIIHHSLWCLGPSSDHSWKYVIPTLTFRDAMKAIANTVGAPGYHYPSSKPFLTVCWVVLSTGRLSWSFRELRALASSLVILSLVTCQIRVDRANSDLGHAIVASRLVERP